MPAEPGRDAPVVLRPRIRIHRAKDARVVDKELMPLIDMNADDVEGLTAATAAGFADGGTARLIMADKATGISITHVAFGPNFVLPRHSHDADCAYYIIAGAAHLGGTVLEAGDSFIVPADHFYSYRAGPAGVELVEFRTRTEFHFRFGGNDPAFWGRIIAASQANGDAWRARPEEPRS